MTDEEMKALDEKLNKVNAKLDEKEKALEERELKIKQEEARANAPKVEEGEVTLDSDMRSALIDQKRAITLSGTGGVKVVENIFTEIGTKQMFASKASKFIGSNAATKIPVISPTVAIPSKVAEGATTITPDSTAALTVTEIDPYTWAAVLGVSWESLKFGPASLSTKISEEMAKAFGKAIEQNMINGAGTDGTMKGLWSSVPDANKSYGATATACPTLAELRTFAVKIKSKDFTNPCMIMTDSAYLAFTATAPSGFDPIYNEMVSVSQSIMGIPIYVTSYPTYATTAGTLIVWAGELENYAIGMASEVTIDTLKKVGDTNTYYQAIASFSGKVIVPANTYGLCVKKSS